MSFSKCRLWADFCLLIPSRQVLVYPLCSRANQMMPLETVGVLQLLQETQLFFFLSFLQLQRDVWGKNGIENLGSCFGCPLLAKKKTNRHELISLRVDFAVKHLISR